MLDSNNNPIDFFPASQNGSFSIAEESTMQHQILWDDPPPEWGVTETRLWGGAQGDPAPDPAVTTPDVIVPAADPNEAFFDVVANSGVRAYWGQMIGSGGDGQLSGPLTADTALAPGEIPGFRVVVIP
jgi:hypothetical protein